MEFRAPTLDDADEVLALHLLYAAGAYAAVLAIHVSDGNRAPGNAEVSQWLHPVTAVAVTVLLVRALTGAMRENLSRIEEERRRRAIEINDDIVQRLVLARYSYEAGERHEGDVAVDEALARARRIMADLVGENHLTPGGLRRDVAANDD